MENNQDRKHLGKTKDGVIFPMHPLSTDMDNLQMINAKIIQVKFDVAKSIEINI